MPESDTECDSFSPCASNLATGEDDFDQTAEEIFIRRKRATEGAKTTIESVSNAFETGKDRHDNVDFSKSILVNDRVCTSGDGTGISYESFQEMGPTMHGCPGNDASIRQMDRTEPTDRRYQGSQMRTNSGRGGLRFAEEIAFNGSGQLLSKCRLIKLKRNGNKR
jgi:hypothetical protein